MRNFIRFNDLGWKLVTTTPDGALAEILPEQMASHEELWRDNDKSCRITWKGHPKCGNNFTVATTWTSTQDGRFEGRIEYRGYDGENIVEQIVFPRFTLPADGNTQFLFACLILNVAELPTGKPVEFSIRNTQMAAFLNPKAPSVYIDWRDGDWNSKSCVLELNDDKSAVACESVFFVPMGDAPQLTGNIPYPASVKTFSGSWFDATQIYKPWARQQPWWTNQTPPNPLRNIDIWVWNRGLAQNALPPVERLQKELPDCHVAMDWYWWHHNPYDTDYPDFWPPREGEDAFRKNVARLKAQGIYTQVYVNGVCLDHDSPAWEQGGKDEVRLKRDGSCQEHAFNKYNNHRLAWMCGSADIFQQKIRSLVRKLHDAGLDGQYLDMIGCSSFWPCYNKNHRHPMGGGHYQVQGFRKMLQDIKRDNPDFPLTTETGSEPYMDLTDAGIVCAVTSVERLGSSLTPVPQFQAIYHGRFITFGNFAYPEGITPWDPLWPPEDKWQDEQPWHRLFPDQFFAEMARTLVFGVQPMVCNLTPNVYENPELKPHWQFILDTASFYAAHKEFLCDGEMLSPDGFSCPAVTVRFQMRTIFTKQANSTVQDKTLPAIMHSRWQAPDGRQALILANYTQNEQPWTGFGHTGVMPPRCYNSIQLN